MENHGNKNSEKLPVVPGNGVEFEQVKVRVLPDGRMTRRDAGRYLGLTEKTLAVWACEGRGPKMAKVGGRVFYFLQDLREFVASGGQS